ncbi:MAG: hypothetical protein ABTQ31_05840 [Rhizobiaceae bacterium]
MSSMMLAISGGAIGLVVGEMFVRWRGTGLETIIQNQNKRLPVNFKMPGLASNRLELSDFTRRIHRVGVPITFAVWASLLAVGIFGGEQ